MEQEKKELERIEQINSYTGKKQEYWCRVMDLYKKKYRQY